MILANKKKVLAPNFPSCCALRMQIIICIFWLPERENASSREAWLMVQGVFRHREKACRSIIHYFCKTPRVVTLEENVAHLLLADSCAKWWRSWCQSHTLGSRSHSEPLVFRHRLYIFKYIVSLSRQSNSTSQQKYIKIILLLCTGVSPPRKNEVSWERGVL